MEFALCVVIGIFSLLAEVYLDYLVIEGMVMRRIVYVFEYDSMQSGGVCQVKLKDHARPEDLSVKLE